MIHVRAAQKTDVPLIAQWYAHSLEQTVSTVELHQAIERDRALLVVAVEGDRLCGFAHAVWSGGPFELLGLVVHPSYQRQGVGLTLMRDILANIRKDDATELWLEVRADNAAAIALYIQCGARVTGQRKGYYRDGVDAVLMSYSGVETD